MTRGRKTYIIAFVMVVFGVVKLVLGDMSGAETIVENSQLILEGLGLAALRAGVAKR